MTDSYWSQILTRRLSRRRALATSGVALTGAALLAACGSSGGGGSQSSKDQNSLVTSLKDTSAQAVAGGTWQTSAVADATSFDVHKIATIPAGRATDFYTFLLKYKLGTQGRTGEITGDSAESWEFSPDGLTLTLKMRPNHGFDPRPPTNSRAMTAQDVKYSWDRFLAFSPQAADLKPANADSPIASLTAPDDKTIVVKLNFPYRSTLDILAYQQYLMIMPVETETGGFDPRSETRGAGPFYLDRWNPSVNLVWKKNPNWYEKGRPFLDGIVETTITDPGTTVSQFESGNLWNGAGYQQEDILRLKKDHPQMVMYQTFPTLGGDSAWSVSQQTGSIFNDVRARQALSMLVDRDLYLEVINGTKSFTDAGLPVDARWNSHIPSPNPEWLDPRKGELGDGSKYFQHNVAEAKKLLAAAGYNNQPLLLQQSDRDDARRLEVLRGMWSDGFNFEVKILAYEPTWRATCQTSAGQDYNGVCYTPGTGFNAEQHIVRWYTPEGRYRYTAAETPVLTALARKIHLELDREKQIEEIKEFQRQAAVIQPLIMSIGAATGFGLMQPWLQNFGLWTNSPATHTKAYVWYDKTKDPNAKTS